MEEIYTMGNRLIVFLYEALPQHPHYLSEDAEISFLRETSQNDLDWIQNRLDVVALRLDEEQLNQFILHDLRGHDKASKERTPRKTQQERTWESFSGWSTTEEDLAQWEDPKDVSFESDELDEMEVMDEFQDNDKIHDSDADDVAEDEDEVETYESDFPDDESYIPLHHSIEEDGEDNSFLRRIAEETVPFETDSECVDSWAPSNTSWSDSGSPSPQKNRRRKPFEHAMANSPKRKVKEDPPGLRFRKIGCFMFRPKSDGKEPEGDEYDRLGLLNNNSDKENTTIRTVPSDEEDGGDSLSLSRRSARYDEDGDDSLSLSRRSVRFDEARNRTKVFEPGSAMREG